MIPAFCKEMKDVKRATLRMAALTACTVVLAMGLAACTPQNASDAKDSSQVDAPASAIDWSPDSDCSTCHADQDSRGSQPAQALGSQHEQRGVACSTCHLEADMQTVHAEHGDSGRTPTKLRYSNVNPTSCLASACHVSQENLAERTADLMAVADSNGLTANPHDLPASPEEGAGHDTLDCFSCHKAHEEVDVVETTLQTCFGCHHQQVFECGTCHE